MPARLAPGRRGVLGIWLWPLMLLLAVGTLDPIGYSGFGDEPLYLQAARCIAAHGYCLPDTHWAARFPLVAPVGWSLRMLGEGYGAVMVAPLLYAAAAILLLIANMRYRFGARAAGIAGATLILTPAFASRASIMSIDVVELAWSLAAVLAWQVAAERRRARLALLAGALLGVAVISRQTALAFAAVLAAGTPLLTRSSRPLAIAAAAGFAGLLAAEALFQLAAGGDALLGWRLSLGHTRIPSTELSAAVDLRESPLFNPAFIGGWRRHAGIELHWTVDGALNLLASGESGLTLVCAVLLGWVAWSSLSDGERSCIRRLCVAAVMHFALLTYALAVNPTPRTFLIEAAIAAAILGVAMSRRWRDGSRALIATAALLLVARGSPDAARGAGYADGGPDRRGLGTNGRRAGGAGPGHRHRARAVDRARGSIDQPEPRADGDRAGCRSMPSARRRRLRMAAGAPGGRARTAILARGAGRGA